MVKSMADKPIIFAMANRSGITPEVAEVRSDAIMATGAPTTQTDQQCARLPYLPRRSTYARPRSTWR
jgi:malic enzyme